MQQCMNALSKRLPVIQFTNTPEEEEEKEESCISFKINSGCGLAIIADIMHFTTMADILICT